MDTAPTAGVLIIRLKLRFKWSVSIEESVLLRPMFVHLGVFLFIPPIEALRYESEKGDNQYNSSLQHKKVLEKISELCLGKV